MSCLVLVLKVFYLPSLHKLAQFARMSQIEAMDAGVGMVAQLGFSKRLSPVQEDTMVRRPPHAQIVKHAPTHRTETNVVF